MFIIESDCSEYFYGLAETLSEQEYDLMILRIEEAITKTIEESTMEFMVDDFLASDYKSYGCGKGSFITLNHFYGPCTRYCIGVKKIPIPEKPLKFKAKIFRKRIYCGKTCCQSTQKYCLQEETVNGLIVYRAVKVGNASYTNITSCEDIGEPSIICGNTLEDDPTIIWRVTNQCQTICAEKNGISNKEQSSNSEENSFQNSRINLKSNGINVKIVKNNDNILVEFINSFEGNVSILDINGRIIATQQNQLYNRATQFSIENFPKGVYLLNFQNTQNQTIVEKIIIQ